MHEGLLAIWHDVVSGKEPGVVVIDLSSKRRHAHIPLGGDPHGIAVRPL